jgi:hypothetical protein
VNICEFSLGWQFAARVVWKRVAHFVIDLHAEPSEREKERESRVTQSLFFVARAVQFFQLDFRLLQSVAAGFSFLF